MLSITETGVLYELALIMCFNKMQMLYRFFSRLHLFDKGITYTSLKVDHHLDLTLHFWFFALMEIPSGYRSAVLIFFEKGTGNHFCA